MAMTPNQEIVSGRVDSGTVDSALMVDQSHYRLVVGLDPNIVMEHNHLKGKETQVDCL